jgi:hypothetical protein
LIGDKGLIIRTFDAGNTWIRQYAGSDTVRMVDVHFKDSVIGITCSNSGELFTTNDGGRRWDTSRIKGIFPYQVYADEKNTFRVTCYGSGRIYSTFDNFNSVDSTDPIIDSEKSYPDFPEQYVFAYCSFNRDTIISYGSYWDSNAWQGNGATKGLIVISTNGGKNWEKPNIFSELIDIRYTSSIDRDTILAVGQTASRSFLISTNRGKTWTADSLRLDSNYLWIMPFGIEFTEDGHPLGILSPSPFAGGEPAIVARGEWKTSGTINSELYLAGYNQHIFPNPSTGIVNLSVSVNSRPVGIYDMLGREVLRETLSESGNLKLDLSSMPTGLYSIILYERTRNIPLGKIIISAK